MDLRLLTGLVISLAATVASAQDFAERSAAASTVAEAFPKMPDELRVDPLPDELKNESAIFVQRRLGEWRERDARDLLGQPRRRRNAFEKGVVTGDIVAFRDPTNRYREFELLFDRQSKTLKSAFIYPWKMTWNDCRNLWGDEVNTTALANGNIFRSYLHRRLDVLVDNNGAVINLGIY